MQAKNSVFNVLSIFTHDEHLLIIITFFLQLEVPLNTVFVV